jgi:acetylornithine deacetylase
MSSFEEVLCSMRLNESRFLGLLENLIGVSKGLQNNPAQGLIPQEDLASDFVLDVLKPFSEECGGPLKVERISFVEGRGNVIITYPGTTSKICSFVGSHLDVVPANADSWERDPFKLVVEGDLLYGRGTTDCLGHVAALTDIMATLAEKRPILETSVVVVFIANEENSIFPGIGVDQLAREGYLDHLRNGPLFWIDSADTHPCIGTCGVAQWQLKVNGKLFHSGLPHKGINSIELAMDAVSYIQKQFYRDYPRHEKEIEYNYVVPSSCKPTQISTANGSINQIPPYCIVEGDMRITPFYDIKDVMQSFEKYVAEINSNPSLLESSEIRSAHSKYVLPDEAKQGIVTVTWLTPGENGVACNLDSPGYRALVEATKKVLDEVKPYSIGGTFCGNIFDMYGPE